MHDVVEQDVAEQAGKIICSHGQFAADLGWASCTTRSPLIRSSLECLQSITEIY